MASTRYISLLARVKELRRCLLPAKFSKLGIYHDTARITVRALSFRVIAHAEIESYFEERALEIANAAMTAWMTNNHVSPTTLSLLGFSGHNMALPPDTLEAPGENQRKSWPEKTQIGTRLKNAVDAYVRYVRVDNHGIRERQIMAMLLPIGIAPSDLDPLAIANIDNFGRMRGETAHSSTAGQLTVGIDPEAEFKIVQEIVLHLDPIDSVLDALQVAALAPSASSPN
jgi:hypothetical protein